MSANIPVKKNWGREIYDISPTLSRQLDEMYTDIVNALQYTVKKDIVTADPVATSQRNSLFNIGDITIRTDTDTAWIMTSRTDAETVVWTQIT